MCGKDRNIDIYYQGSLDKEQVLGGPNLRKEDAESEGDRSSRRHGADCAGADTGCVGTGKCRC